jgi:adenylate cyclase class 2
VSTKNDRETEVKIAVPNVEAIRQRLDALGFKESAPRLFEANTLYDTAERKLRCGEMLLRLREVGGKGVVTWKGPSIPGPHKSRPELETTVADIEVLSRILRQLEFQPVFRYEKYRTEFCDQAGTVTLDETPVGHFLELEGPGEWIDRTAHRLGFRLEDYLLASYGKIYLDDCARRGVQPGDMVFAAHP